MDGSAFDCLTRFLTLARGMAPRRPPDRSALAKTGQDTHCLPRAYGAHIRVSRRYLLPMRTSSAQGEQWGSLRWKGCAAWAAGPTAATASRASAPQHQSGFVPMAPCPLHGQCCLEQWQCGDGSCISLGQCCSEGTPTCSLCDAAICENGRWVCRPATGQNDCHTCPAGSAFCGASVGDWYPDLPYGCCLGTHYFPDQWYGTGKYCCSSPPGPAPLWARCDVDGPVPEHRPSRRIGAWRVPSWHAPRGGLQGR